MALLRVHSSSIFSRHALIQFKVLHRLQYSKVRLAKIFTNINTICDRCNQALATNYHMLRSCPNWHLSGIPFLTRSPSHIIVIFSPVLKLASLELCHVQMGLVFQLTYRGWLPFSPRRAILCKWKDSNPPTSNQWIRDVMLNIKLEKIRCTLNDSVNTFYKMWGTFIQHVNLLYTLCVFYPPYCYVI